MKIRLFDCTIGDVAKGYVDKKEDGVVGYGGKLNIRPAYQREFVYSDKKRDAVIKTIMSGFPLNVMYWAKNTDGTYEVLDGQQRTVSFCQFVNGEFSITDANGSVFYFHNLPEDKQIEILSYKLLVYVCEEDDDGERLDWFRTINIAGEKLTEQELLNINYVGKWLSSAKLRFSKTNCVAYMVAGKYINGSPIRQEYLETVLGWISDGHGAEYMAKHQYDENSDELWNYFRSVIEWIDKTFPYYRKEMKGINWGALYKEYFSKDYNPEELENQVKELMSNDEVTDKKGIYEYVLSGCDENKARRLSKRTFSNTDKRTVYERQNGVCPICGGHFSFEEMDGDHKVAWWRGGKTTIDNLQMVCKKCNGNKSGKSF